MHKKIAIDIINYLHDAFPDASIALSGSVANDTYNHDSDIDLLIVRKNVTINRLIHFTYESYKISIFVFSKNILYDLRNYFFVSYNCMPMALINDSIFVYDQDNISSHFKSIINELLIIKNINRKEFSQKLKNKLFSAVEIEGNNKKLKQSKLRYIYGLIINIFYLDRKEQNITNKKTAYNPLFDIKDKDYTLYSLIKEYISEDKTSSNQRLDEINKYLLINY